MKLIPKNWEKFQHYKHRSPPWIKLHRDILDDYDWWCLPIASRALAPCLWLLASSEDNGEFDATPEKLAFRFRMTEKEIISAIKPLIDKGYFICDSEVLAECKQDALTEESKSRVKVEKEKEYSPPIPAELLSEWLIVRKKKPVTERVFNAVENQARQLGWTAEQAIIKCCERGWTGFDASWIKDNKPKTYQDSREAAARTAFGSLLNTQFQIEKVIDHE